MPQQTLSKPRTAKVFKTGRSQAVRLPKEFRFTVSEVFIRRDQTTGEIILSTKAPNQFTWAEFFEAVRSIPQAERDQLPERSVIVTKQRKSWQRSRFAPWTELTAKCFARLRTDAEAKGVTVDMVDLMIATHAKEDASLTLVTNDQALLRLKPWIKVVDWTK